MSGADLVTNKPPGPMRLGFHRLSWPIQRGVRLPKKSSKLGCARCFSLHANANGELRGGFWLGGRSDEEAGR
jgi:hypothetical protein